MHGMLASRARRFVAYACLASSLVAAGAARADDAKNAPTPAASASAQPAAGAETASAAAEPPPSPDEVPALVFASVAFGSLATGAVFGVLAWQDHATFLTSPTSDTANRGQSRAFTADMCFAAAAGFALISVVMFLRPDPSDTHGGPAPPPPNYSKPRLSFAPYISPQGGGGAAVLRW